MTQTERTRFTILIAVLAVLVVAGVLVQRARNSKVGADILGVIRNQAVATYSDKDGNKMEATLSDQSELIVASGTNNLTINYKLDKRTAQAAVLDIEIFRPGDDAPLLVLTSKKGDNGTLLMRVKNLANGSYDIAVKPRGYLSQVVTAVNYQNGTPVVVDFKDPFLWGDIDVTHDGRGDNGDNMVNVFDWTVLTNAWDTADAKADFNGDGAVNSLDAGILSANWGKQGARFDVDQLKPSPTPIPDSEE